jgi:hypothetical protein
MLCSMLRVVAWVVTAASCQPGTDPWWPVVTITRSSLQGCLGRRKTCESLPSRNLPGCWTSKRTGHPPIPLRAFSHALLLLVMNHAPGPHVQSSSCTGFSPCDSR